jgi:acetyl-CoA acetyltransferase family protein
MTTQNTPVIVDALRTPLGRRKGSLSGLRADELGARVLNALVERNNIDADQIDDVVTGCVTQTGEQGLNIARQIALASQLPFSVTGTSVNRLCGSSLQALNFAAMGIASGYQDVVIALGTESMSRVAMGSDGGSINPRIMDRYGIVPQGQSAELMATKWGLGRDELDAFSLQSHRRAIEAQDKGHFQREILPIRAHAEGRAFTLEKDETPRNDTSLEKLGSLAPAFDPRGVITAGSSSQISDGAAGIVLMSEKKAAELGQKPRARIVAMATAGVDPTIMLTGPAPATKKALKRAGLKLDQIDAIECNEAFASVPLVFAKELDLDPQRMNPRGGAIALGHPLGATGARLITTLVHTLEDQGGHYGLATLCIGFGQGITTIIERL